MIRYYLKNCEFKWSHVGTRMEDIWIRRELSDDLYKQCNQDGFNLVMIHSNSQTLPSDMYCRCDIYVDVKDSKQGMLFALKYETAIAV